MNTKTILVLRSIAKDKGLRGYYKRNKAGLLALLLEKSSEQMPTPPPRRRGKERRRTLPVKMIPSSQEINELGKEEMKKSRPVVESRLSRLHKWLDDYVPKSIKKAVDKAFITFKNGILRLHDGAKKTLKSTVEKVTEEEQQQEEDADLTPHGHERILKGVYRSFVRPGRRKTDVDSYFDQTKPHIKTLIENQLKEMEPAKII